MDLGKVYTHPIHRYASWRIHIRNWIYSSMWQEAYIYETWLCLDSHSHSWLILIPYSQTGNFIYGTWLAQKSCVYETRLCLNWHSRSWLILICHRQSIAYMEYDPQHEICVHLTRLVDILVRDSFSFVTHRRSIWHIKYDPIHEIWVNPHRLTPPREDGAVKFSKVSLLSDLLCKITIESTCENFYLSECVPPDAAVRRCFLPTLYRSTCTACVCVRVCVCVCVCQRDCLCLIDVAFITWTKMV